GAGFGALVMLIRRMSGYPEGVMFAVLIMNALVPLINRWAIPTPVGGPVPVKKTA
ncbi:MAG: RnfABCDGE type electron transport complex subunit D, partial [Verrucomicrobia bacterium]|nr:RnfABCDGE type electron transport complex subunit D [Verrucomicrobiota bacterium]